MSEGERSSTDLSEEIEELQFATYEEWYDDHEIERNDVKEMIGLFTERNPNNLDRRSWMKAFESRSISFNQNYL